MKKPSKLLSALTSLALAVFLVTGAVAVHILCRGFYYGAIDPLGHHIWTGFSPAVIREAFDQVMDYLVLGAPFGTGQLKWSAEGMAHFADCKALFQLDFIALGLSAVFLLVILLLVWRKKVSLHPFLGRGPCFWAFAFMTLAVLALGTWGLLDFEGLFTAFHCAFFPGKTNWLFDYRTDQIILILPEAFWARAAALVAGLAFGLGLLLTLLEALFSRRPKYKTVYEELKNQ